MKESTRRLIGFSMAISVALALAPEAAAQAPTSSPADGSGSTRMIVAFEPGAKAAAKRSIVAEDARVIDHSAAGDFFVVEAPGTARRFKADVAGDPGVLYSEPDRLVTASDVTPSDPAYTAGSLWGLPNIGLPRAWETQVGSREVIVGIVDTGVDHRHPDLASQMWVNADEAPGDGIDNDHDGFIDNVHGADCYSNDGDPMDPEGHGTHVAGTIGAQANNDVGVAGVNWNVSIMALRFLGSDGSGWASDAAQCIDFATRNGVKISNHSWGGGDASRTLLDAIERARDAGHLMIAAAGNDGIDNDSMPQYPASYPVDNIISVAATRSDDTLAYYSNYGRTSVDIAAPGHRIYSTIPGGYAQMSGTSMATPHVAGVAALARAQYPDSTHLDIRHRLLSGARPLSVLTGKVASGGVVHAPGALDHGTGDAPATGISPVLGSTKSASATSLRVVKRRDRLRATGRVRPRHAGKRVAVSLYKKRDGRFVRVAVKRPVLSAYSRYSTRFRRRGHGRCRIVVRFRGDDDHSGSRAAIRFRC